MQTGYCRFKKVISASVGPRYVSYLPKMKRKLPYKLETTK